MPGQHLDPIIGECVDVELAASAVHRLMNEKYLSCILTAIKKAALSEGWCFRHTKEEHLLPPAVREHLIAVIWPASAGYIRPTLRSAVGSLTYDELHRDAVLEGWSESWLDHTLDALRQLGIRLVPCVSGEGYDGN